MKTTIKITGFISLFLISIGTLFKLLHLPGSNLLLLFGPLCFTVLFLPVFFIRRIRNSESSLEKATNIIGLIALTDIFFGVIFKNLHISGANILLLLGTFLFAFIALPLYMFGVKKKSEKSMSEKIALVFIGIYCSMFIILYSLRFTFDIINTYVVLSDQQVKSTKAINEIIADYDRMMKDKDIECGEIKKIEDLRNDLLNYIQEIRILLISYSESEYNTDEIFNNYRLISNGDDIDITNYCMGWKKGKELKNKIINYQTSICNYLTTHEKKGLAIEINSLLNTGDVKTERGLMNWDQAMFNNVPLTGALAILNGIEHDIKTAELFLKRSIVTDNNTTQDSIVQQ